MNFKQAGSLSYVKVACALGLIGIGFASGWLVYGRKAPVTISSVRNNDTPYKLIDPSLYIEVSESLSFPKYSALEKALTAEVSRAKSSNQATDVGVYFRDLGSNNWIGVNYTDQFDPASMAKVVTLMTLLRVGETSPSVLTANIQVPTNVSIPSDDQDFAPPANPIKSGQTYNIQDLMSRLITQSDNGANALLVNYLGSDAFTAIFTDLHVPGPSSTGQVSPQQYSHLFRVLYNASYLSPADSEEALELLSHTTFTQGLVAGVPTGTIVAHKFGERTTGSGAATVHELHDCGIVYYPEHPYFLCVMTRGTDFPSLAKVLQSISRVTWEQVTDVNTK